MGRKRRAYPLDRVCGRLHGASGALLLLAQREIPMGTAYAVWTGIGAIGAFVVGIAAFGDASTAMRFVSVGLITAGIVGLKLA